MTLPINVLQFPKQYQHLVRGNPPFAAGRGEGEGTLGAPLITAVTAEGEAALFAKQLLSMPPAGAKAIFTPAVMDLQRALIEWGFPPKGGADGYFGDNTRLALEALQRKLGAGMTGVWTEIMAAVIARDLRSSTSVIRAWQRAQGLVVPGGAPPAPTTAAEPSGLTKFLTSPWTWVGLALVGAGVFWLKSSGGPRTPYVPLAERGTAGLEDGEDEDEDEDEDEGKTVDGEIIKVITPDDKDA